MQKEFLLKTEAGIFGKIVFATAEFPDRLTEYNESMVSAGDRAFYQQFYAQSNTPLDTTRAIQHECIWKILFPYLRQAAKVTSLDVGCGRGKFVNFLTQKLNMQGIQGQAFGIEPSLSLETNQLKKVDIFQLASDSASASVKSLPSRYTLVSLLDVLEHFSEPEKALQAVSVLMENEGYCLIKVPNKLALSYRLARALTNYFPRTATKILLQAFQLRLPPPHYYYYSPESLVNLLEKNNFSILELAYFSEVPLRGMFSRFWYLPKPLRIFPMIFVPIYRLFSLGRWNDSVVVLAKKK